MQLQMLSFDIIHALFCRADDNRFSFGIAAQVTCAAADQPYRRKKASESYYRFGGFH